MCLSNLVAADAHYLVPTRFSAYIFGMGIGRLVARAFAEMFLHSCGQFRLQN